MIQVHCSFVNWVIKPVLLITKGRIAGTNYQCRDGGMKVVMTSISVTGETFQV